MQIKHFRKNGTEKLFIGSTLILFSRVGGYKPRYDSSRENLYSIVLLAKEKGINQFLEPVVHDKNIDEYDNTMTNYYWIDVNDTIVKYEEYKKSMN